MREEIGLYVLGAADETKTRLIEKHLSKCTDCPQGERKYKLILTQLRRQNGSSNADSGLILRIQSATNFLLNHITCGQ